jgi:hypothetical protein
MDIIKNYVRNNSQTLFKNVDTINNVVFDNRGFYFSKEAQIVYNQIKDLPHLYVAWTESREGFYYVGKSFQNGGRWKRSHAYHLGTLTHHLLDTIRYDDQNHQHWIDNWMQIETLNLGNNEHFIQLHQEVKICFIPFKLYSGQGFNTLDKNEIRPINKKIEEDLIKSYLADGLKLLNVQNNRNVKSSDAKNKKTTSKKSKIQNENILTIEIINKCIEKEFINAYEIHQYLRKLKFKEGKWTIKIFETKKPGNLICPYYGNSTKIPSKYIGNSDETRNVSARWKMIDEEMIYKKIDKVTVKVCPLIEIKK